MRKTFLPAAIFSSATLATALVFAGCGPGPAESESKMTSYSGTEAKADTASLFTVPQDQMAHIQVVAVEKTKLSRLLRLTGNATYNAFKTLKGTSTAELDRPALLCAFSICRCERQREAKA